MAQCYPGTCFTSDRLTKSDLDRFTDRIHNVLNDKNGLRRFENFLNETSNARSGKKNEVQKCLELWKICKKTIHLSTNNDEEQDVFKNKYMNIGEKADRINCINESLMEDFDNATTIDDKKCVLEALKSVLVKEMEPSYRNFREYLLSTHQQRCSP